MTKRSKPELDGIIRQVQHDVLEVINRHTIQKGIVEAEDALYIATIGITQALAVAAFSQLKAEHLQADRGKRMQDDLMGLFRSYSDTIIGRILGEEEDPDEPAAETTGSWSKRKGRESK